ncbi:MAG: serine/threonine-protein kinase [Myxococcota bacterium]
MSSAPQADHNDARIGANFVGYEVVNFVADGAMGRVYEARGSTGDKVALKVLHREVVKDTVAVERFKREYETAEELEHPYIVRVLDFGETPDRSWYLAMEFLEGEELGEALRRDGALPLPRVLRVLCQAAVALDFAHGFGVIHRDLKPDNIFLCRTDAGDEVRLLDFGTVKLQMETGPKLTAFGTTIGSPYYMSPEQAMGKLDVDQRTDVFAVAAILFEMLTGKIAFHGQNIAEILMKVVNEAAPIPSMVDPSLDAALDAVIDRGLRKEKEERYGSVGELANATLAAVGLSGTAEDWAKKSIGEIAMGLNDVLRSDPARQAAHAQGPAPAAPTPEPAAPPTANSAPWPEEAPSSGQQSAAGISAPSLSGPLVVGGLVVIGLVLALIAALVVLFIV